MAIKFVIEVGSKVLKFVKLGKLGFKGVCWAVVEIAPGNDTN